MPWPSSASASNPVELLMAVVRNAPIVLFAVDPDGVFTLSEGRALDALGLEPGEVVGKSIFELYKSHPAILDACRRALKGETVTQTAALQGLVFEARYAPQLDWGGKITGVLGVATDVSEPYRHLLSKDEFLSVISHELRTPLSSAAGWAALLREGELTAAETEKALEVVCRNLADLKRLIGELRDASSTATGRLTLKVKACDLGLAVREAAASLADAAQAKEQTLAVDAPALRGAADKARWRQIAWILLSNAIKYSPKGAVVSARLERRGDEAVLTVVDAGPGVPAALRPGLFDLTYLPDDGRPRGRGRGLGLGLAIARRLAELHGGSIAFSDAPTGGSAFAVSLPLSRR
ncbi:MAG: PAS domain-containing sensor histidine kinase [Elusimicrobiota bacterium]|nr:PAS domain-containing sensor histidine kinase [Elusimicrobiota bacterium]